jgi:hypothetical protein
MASDRDLTGAVVTRPAWRRLAVAAGTVGAVLMLSAGTAAAQVPGVTTGGAARITSQGATLTGQVNPRGLSTTYFFEYGTTTAYGARTTPTAAGQGTTAAATAAPVAGLAPATRYHFRLVAQNASGVARGGDRTFRTAAQPLALALAATPNPLAFGGAVMISGTLSGTGGGGQTVQLQQRPFPFVGGFAPVGNAVVTDAQGRFAVALLSVALTTQYRAVVAGRPGVAGPVLTLGVQPVVRARVTRRRVRRGGRVHFSGTVRPGEAGRPLAVQKRRGARWVTVSGMLVRPGTAGVGVYGKTIRVRRGGSYRIYAGAGSGATVPAASRSIRIRTS